jgi:high-affinity nickel-transport protein
MCNREEWGAASVAALFTCPDAMERPGTMQPAPETLAALCGFALILGARHGLDADHLAVVDGLTRRSSQAGRRTACYSGALFSLGHGGVVVLTAAAAAFATGRWRTPEWLAVSGALISAAFLIGLGLLNVLAVFRTPRDHLVQPRGLRASLFQRLIGAGGPLGVMGVGVLFAVSFDTISQAALFAVFAAKLGGGALVLAAAACFVVGMLLTDGLNGLWIARMLARADRRARFASRAMTSVIGWISLCIGSITLAGVAAPQIQAWFDNRELWIAAGVIGCIALSFAGIALAAPTMPAPVRSPAR